MTATTFERYTVHTLEEMFQNKPPCEYIGDGQVGKPKTGGKCSLPATWLWVFETQCTHSADEYYLCATHHVILSDGEEQQVDQDNPWKCRICYAPAYVKEKRRI